MRKIIINCILFLLLFGGWNIYLKNTSSFYLQENAYQKSIDSVLDSKSKIVLLGDSHLASLKKSNLNNEVGNLAYGADGYKEIYAKVLILLKNNPNLEYVFLSTEPQMFNASTSPNGTFLNKYALHSKTIRSLYGKNKLDIVTDNVPLFNNDYLNFFRNKLYNKLKGTKGANQEENWKEATIERKTEISKNLGNSDHAAIMGNPKDTIYFKEMMTEFKNRGVKVISIRFPVTSNYIGQCSGQDEDKVNQFLSHFEFYKNLDYSNTIKSIELFEDPDHLNKQGVLKITAHIESDTGLPIIAQ